MHLAPPITLANASGFSRPIDAERWHVLTSRLTDEPSDTLPQQVKRSSKGRPWHGLTVWHQVGPVGDLYIQPAQRHCIIVRRTHQTQLLQRQGTQTEMRCWSPGEAVIVPAETPSFWRSTSPRDNVHIDLSPQWLQRAAGRKVDELRIRNCFGAADPILSNFAELLLASLDSNTSMRPEFGEGVALSLAVHLLENYEARPSPQATLARLSARQMQRIKDLVASRLDEAWPVKRIAEEMQLSPFHFSRCFKASCGLTPHAFVVRERMTHARQLLISTKAPIIEIAQDIGYASAAHFAQAFRRFWGAKPTEVRRSKS